MIYICIYYSTAQPVVEADLIGNVRLQDEFRFVFTIFEKSKMAASMVGFVVGSNKVTRCLYALTLMNMQNIASGDSGSMNLRVITLGHAKSAIVTMTLTYLSQTWTTLCLTDLSPVT